MDYLKVGRIWFFDRFSSRNCTYSAIFEGPWLPDSLGLDQSRYSNREIIPVLNRLQPRVGPSLESLVHSLNTKMSLLSFGTKWWFSGLEM